MCGVFGFISNGNPLNPDRLEAIARETQTRGAHAHGLAWINRDGRLRQYRSRGRITDNLDCLDTANDARMLIGHCRWATAGDPGAQINNHPHPCDGGWLVHNGVVSNDAELVDRWGLTPSSDCDSEVIAQLIETIDGATLLDRTCGAMAQVRGAAVVLGLWTRPARLLIVRRGRPLHLMQDEHGSVYFASLPGALDDADRFLDNTARIMEVRDGDVVQTTREIKPCPASQVEPDPRLNRPARCYRRG